MTPTATRLQQRLQDRRDWFQNEWFFKWHQIGGDRPVQIDRFNGGHAHYSGIKFAGSARDIYWQAVVYGMRKEIIEQLKWVEESVKGYHQAAGDRAIDECAGLLTSFIQVIRREAIEKDCILRGNGVDIPFEQDFGRWNEISDEKINDQAKALKSSLFPDTNALEAEPPVVAPTRISGRSPQRYQVALSFAGEQREYVDQVAKALKERQIAVFYDKFETNNLWGKDGAEPFHRIFAQDSEYVVMFISAEYVAKKWPSHERRSAISFQIQNDGEYILPVRFDKTLVPGLPDTLQYLVAEDYTPTELAVEIAKKIGVSPTSGKASNVPPPASEATFGEVTFDYSAYNGRYVIGSGVTAFETAWSKASDTSVHLLNDPPSIHGIAIARGATQFEQLGDATTYDFTSRSRTVQTGEIAVLRNVHGFFAAIKVINVEDDTRGAANDALTVRYAILHNGENNFTQSARQRDDGLK